MSKNYCYLLACLMMLNFLATSSVVDPSRTASKKGSRERGGGGRKHRQRMADILQDGKHHDEGVCEMEVSCRTASGEMMDAKGLRLPVAGPPGPPGPPGEKGIKGEDGANGLPGLPGLSAPTPHRVAFFAGLSDNVGPVTEPTDVKFDRVVTNVGGGYDAKTGRFKSPKNGTYQFNVVISAQGKQRAAVMILKNGAMIATVWAESVPLWGTASNVVILSLEQGDEVWVLLLNRASHLHGYMYTTYSGFLIFEN